MSEFSDSYHLLTNDHQAAVRLLKKAGVEGYVFPPTDGWVTLVAEGLVFRPNFELIEANEGILLHLVSAEDHGWYFSLYNGAEQVAHYECYWEEDLYVHDAEFDLTSIKKLLADKIKLAPAAMDEELARIFYPEELDYTCNPVTRLAHLLGLQHVDWVAYSCVREDHESGTGIYQVSPVK